MSRQHPAARRLFNDYGERMADDFEAALLHNVVYDRVPEDDQLQQLCEAVAHADLAAAMRRDEPDEDVENIDRAEGRLQWTARQRALEVVAEACALVIREADDWVDAWGQDKIDAAQAEAKQWLRHHSNEAERADVEYGYDEQEVDA